MRIKEFFVTGYKNLSDCRFFPEGVHAITGCNSSGKSNLLEVIPFIVGLHSFSDERRSDILTKGRSPIGLWFPDTEEKKYHVPFHFSMSCELTINQKAWLITYDLKFPGLKYGKNAYDMTGPGFIASETITAKLAGTPGKATLLLSRGSEGITTVVPEQAKRTRMRFRTKGDMSALQALEVREAEDFGGNFPVLSAFRSALLLTNSLTVDANSFQARLENPERESGYKRDTSGFVSEFDPYELLQELKTKKDLWAEYKSWLKRLADIDDMVLVPHKGPTGSSEQKYIFPRQHGRLMFSSDLSTGAALIVAIVTAVYTFLRRGGLLLIEEPETRLHPGAIVDLITLFRDVAKDRSIVFSTHSPVAINSMQPSEVTVMKPLEHGFFTTQAVSDLDDAVQALARNFLSFGDLLQLNFAPQADSGVK